MYSQQPPSPPTLWPDKGPRKSGVAVAALICSLVGLIPCFAPASLVGAILGGVGLGSVSKSRGQKSGKGMALAGLLIGIVGIAWNIGFWLLMWTGIFGATLDSVSPLADKYLTLISESKYEEAYEMTSPTFRMATSLEEFKRYNEEIKKLDGEYKSKEFKFLRGSSMNIKKDNTGTTVTIRYIVNYTKRDGVGRTLIFRKHGDAWLIEGDSAE